MSEAAPTLSDDRPGSDDAAARPVVRLRPHRLADAERCFEQCRDPESVRWTTVPLGYTRSMATDFVGRVMPEGWATGREWAFALEVDGRYGGTLSLRDEGGGRAEVAYGAHPDVRGSGAVGRGLRLLLDWGFAERDLRTVVWRADVGNWASRRTAWRLGFGVEGTLRGYLPHRGELRDAWVGTLRHDDPREPTTPWLEVTPLEADGLVLRAFRDTDVPRVVEACSDPVTQAWLGQLPAPYDEAAARAYLEHQREQRASGRGVVWAVVDPADDLVLASVGWFDHTPGVDLEVGWWAHPDARGRGVVSRAVRRVVAHAFDDLRVQGVRVFAALGNTASQRVAEAVGMTRTGLLPRAGVVRDGRADLVAYDLSVTAWRERRSSVADHRSTPMPSTESAAPTSAGER